MTSPAFFLPAIANNVTTPQLIGAIGAADVTVALKTGHGALLPAISRGAATSTTNSMTLTDTGDLGGLAVGDRLLNLTDGSNCVVRDISSAPNTVKTTPLEGGSDNTWQSGDVWVKGAYIVTGVHYDTDGVTVLKRERMRVVNLVTDTLTVERGYDGDAAQTFSANDYIQILVEKSMMENLQKAVSNIVQKVYDIWRAVPWYITTTGSTNAYAATIPNVIAMTDLVGVRLTLKANFGNTNSATLNVNAIGAQTIKKLGGTANLASGDIPNGMVFEVVWDGTYFQMTTPPGQTAPGVPSGSMVIWTTDSAPTDWLLCYGQAVSRTTYAALYAVIGDTFGAGDGSTTFNLPDMRGRFPLGQDDMGGSSANRVTHANADTLGSSQGAESVNIDHTHSVPFGQGINTGMDSNAPWGDDNGTATTGSMSANATPNIMNPYLTVNYIIKT